MGAVRLELSPEPKLSGDPRNDDPPFTPLEAARALEFPDRSIQSTDFGRPNPRLLFYKLPLPCLCSLRKL